MASILTRHPDAPVRAFVVWEPILSTDWSPPSTFALNRIPDLRARQFWDPDHVVAKKLAADKREPQPEQECCERGGILWDLAAVYPRGATWSDRVPPAVLFNGPVVDVKSELESSFVAGPRSVTLDRHLWLPPSGGRNSVQSKISPVPEW